MQDRILTFFYLLAERHRRPVVTVMLALTVLLGLFIPGLKISSSYNDLVSPQEPEQARYLKFLDEFGATNDLVVVLEGDPETLKNAADFFAREILNEEEFVKSVFYQIDIRGLLRHAPLFIPLESLKEGLEYVTENQRLLDRIANLDNLSSILRLIQRSFVDNQAGGEIDPAAAPYLLRGTNELFRQWRLWLDNPWWDDLDLDGILADSDSEEAAMIKSRGYFLSHDQRLLFIFVQPKSACDDITYLQPFNQAVRSAGHRVFQKHPALKGKIKVAFTGMPAHALTEMETINADVRKATAISVMLVLLFLFLGFRSLQKIILAVIPLACGMIMTVGLVRLIIGHLNLISSSFLAVLFGIGIDFGIYLIRRTAEELGHGARQEAAVRTALLKSGKSVLTGGLATGLAFLAVALSDFVGFSELGITAGLGVLVVLFTTFLMLPSLLLLFHITPHYYNVRWVEKISRQRKSRRLLIVIVVLAAGLAGFGIFAATRLTLDFNALRLLPPEAESTVYQLKMQNESNFQMTGAAVSAESLSELKNVTRRMEKLPLVSRVDSFAEIIPDDQPAKLRLITGYRPYLADLRFRFHPTETSTGEYIETIDELVDRFEDAQEAAFAAGQAGLVEAIEENLKELNRIGEYLAGGEGETALERTRAFERTLFDYAERMNDLLHDWLETGPITENFFPPEIRGKFKSSRGTYVAYVYPDGSLWDLDFLARFVSQLKEITPEVTGFPVTHRMHARMMISGLVQALIYAFCIIVVLLVIDFRQLGPVLLSLIPLVVGMLWVQGMMYLLGLNYNFGSLPGLPLILGLGVVYGVHIVRRWMEHPHSTAFDATMTSGRGVAFASLTTIAGLVSLLFASHKGVTSFGIIILLGILSSLGVALFVLPAVIDLIYLKKPIYPPKMTENYGAPPW